MRGPSHDLCQAPIVVAFDLALPGLASDRALADLEAWLEGLAPDYRKIPSARLDQACAKKHEAADAAAASIAGNVVALAAWLQDLAGHPARSGLAHHARAGHVTGLPSWSRSTSPDTTTACWWSMAG
jgi:hypothetical protein